MLDSESGGGHGLDSEAAGGHGLDSESGGSQVLDSESGGGLGLDSEKTTFCHMITYFFSFLRDFILNIFKVFSNTRVCNTRVCT